VYLLGGRPPGASRTYPGTRAGVPALDVRPFAMPGRLVFAWHSPTWDGAIAFHDPTGQGEVLSTAYLLPPATFSDVVEQEMWRRPGVDHDLSEVLGRGRQVLGPGRYETLHLTGELDGRPVVTFSADDPSALEPGEILIAPITDPAWTPLFVAASAVVVDVGAPFSHAAIVSRELGIPCVVSATEASKRIGDGALIEVNGDTGTVTILEHAAESAVQ